VTRGVSGLVEATPRPRANVEADKADQDKSVAMAEKHKAHKSGKAQHRPPPPVHDPN
jgi:hypothetical protein